MEKLTDVRENQSNSTQIFSPPTWQTDTGIRYKAAYESLKRVPYELAHPIELRQVKGFGEKLTEKMIQDYERYCDSHGIEMPPDPRFNRIRRRAAVQVDESQEEEEEEQERAAPKRRKTNKQYIPKRASGPYAILLGLYKENMRVSDNTYISKENLIAVAQPYCDSSFTQASNGSFYTAWNSCKDLCDKNLVHQKGRPAKFALTKEGYELASLIAEGEESYETGERRGFSRQGPANRGLASLIELASPTATATSSSGVTSKRNGSTGNARNGHRVNLFNGENEGDPSRIGNRLAAPDRSESITIIGSDRNRSTGNVQQDRWLAMFNEGSESDEGPSRNRGPASRRVYSSTSTRDKRQESFPPTTNSPQASRSRVDADYRRQRQPFSRFSTDSEGEAPHNNNRPYHEDTVSGNNFDRGPSMEAAESESLSTNQALPKFTATSFPPGSFEIHMIIDNREKTSKTAPDYLQTTLARKHGIQAMTRPLSVGDVQWIAKHITTGQEVVLDFIIERKRLDDLIGSIKDGRFHEQKTRLRRSGISKVVYIIEEYAIAGNGERSLVGGQGIGMEAIETAIASLQLVEGIFVKRTAKADETIRYLANITRRLQRQHENETLYIIPNSALDLKTYPKLKEHLLETEPDKSYHVDYQIFQDMMEKGATVNLKEVFIRMLMCVRGVTAQKALYVQSIFGTPYGLIKAYENCNSDREREELLANKCGDAVAKKAISKQLSALVAKTWAPSH